MKLQAITMIAALSGLLASTSADAQKFELGKANKPQVKISQPNQSRIGNYLPPQTFPISKPGRGGDFTILPYPTPKPPTHILPPPAFCKPKPPICPPPVIIHPPVCVKPPICPPVKPPICIKPPICPPVKPPVCIKPPICPPVKPPVCIKPPICPPVEPPCHTCECHVCKCHKPVLPICHKPISQLPINRPPVKLVTMTLMNNAGADVHFSLNSNEQVETMPADSESVVESRSLEALKIAYHNGVEVVEYELDPSAAYSFEWEGEALQLLQVQG